MSSLWFVVAALLVAPVIGFVGLAVASTPVGQYALAALICVIATYWMTLSHNTHRMG